MGSGYNTMMIGENTYTQQQAWDALHFVVKHGYSSAITPNPDRTVYEVDAPPPVPNVGQTFVYKGKPVKNDVVTLPRGEAGDDYTDLEERVAIIEQSYLMRIEAIEADAKSEREYVRGTFRVLEEWLTKFHNRLAKF